MTKQYEVILANGKQSVQEADNKLDAITHACHNLRCSPGDILTVTPLSGKTEEKASEAIGRELLLMFNKRLNKDGRVMLGNGWGDKTALGLGRTVRSLIDREDKKEGNF